MTSLSADNQNSAIEQINQRFEEREAQQYAQKLGYQYVDLSHFPINPDVLRLVSFSDASSLGVVPFYQNGSQLKLAVVDPERSGIMALQKQFEEAHYNVTLWVCSQRAYDQVLTLYHSDLVNKKQVELRHEFEEKESDNLESKFLEFGELETALRTLSASEALNAIEIAAVQVRASDIHLQPYEGYGQLRFRVDGLLHDIAQMPRDKAQKLVVHIKYQAGMKSNVDHIPQDGSLRFVANNRQIDLRVSTLPTEWFESVVMRVLDSHKGLKSFSELGFEPQVENTILRALRRKSGMVLVTGPTGSGKTTTLYAMLKELNDPGKKLVSLEDPVEYHLDGVTQSPVDQRSEYTFSNGLKALLRHDPDVILIGEIRDAKTAKLASEAALTGHVVLSSLHTNSALGAITRLQNLGLESYNIASCLNAVFAQRLVRRVCPYCAGKAWVNLDEHERASRLIAGLESEYKDFHKHYESKGEHEGLVGRFIELPQPGACARCSHTGYLGQTVICETLWMTDDFRAAVARGDEEQTLRQLVPDATSLFRDGLRKVLLGETTLDEIYRVAG